MKFGSLALVWHEKYILLANLIISDPNGSMDAVEVRFNNKLWHDALSAAQQSRGPRGSQDVGVRTADLLMETVGTS